MANKFDVPCCCCCCYDFSSKLGQHIADEDDLDLPCGVHCCVCCCNCIANSANFVITTIINLILFVCVASFLVWIMLRSNSVKFQVHDAQLTRFDLDIENNNNLHYNLSLNFSIRNSNSHIGIHYDRFEAIVYYNYQRLSAVSVPSFYQGHKSTTVLETVFQGQNLVFLDGGKFEEDQKLGGYGIDVKVRIKSRVLFAHLITWPMKPIIRCHLKLPLGSSNSTGGFEFQSTKCHLNF